VCPSDPRSYAGGALGPGLGRHSCQTGLWDRGQTKDIPPAADSSP